VLKPDLQARKREQRVLKPDLLTGKREQREEARDERIKKRNKKFGIWHMGFEINAYRF